MKAKANTKMDVTACEPIRQLCKKLARTDREFSENLLLAIQQRLQPLLRVMADPTADVKDKIIASKQARLDLQELRAPYARYAEQIDLQESVFARIAAEATDVFFETLYDSMAAYFAEKYDAIVEALKRDSRLWTSFSDTWRKSGARVVNILGEKAKWLGEKITEPDVAGKSKEWLGKAFGDTGKRVGGVIQDAAGSAHAVLEKIGPSDKLLEERTLLERTLEEICPTDEIVEDITALFDKAMRAYEKIWRKRVAAFFHKIELGPHDMGTVNMVRPEFTLDVAEQIFAVTFGATLVGTFGLAAGWHTITYSMMHVFPPLAVFALVATAAAVYWRKDQSIKERCEQARKLLNMYHAQLVIYIDTQRLPEHGNMTIRQFVSAQSLAAAQELNRQWTSQRFGKLSKKKYENIGTAIDACCNLLARECEMPGGEV